MISIKNNYVKIDTENTSLVLFIHGPKLEIVYYGNKIDNRDEYSILHYKGRNAAHGECDDERFTGNYTFSNYGIDCDREFSIIIKNADGTFANKFDFVDAKISEKPEYINFPCSRNPSQTVEFVFVDKEENVELRQFYSCFKGTDVIAVSNQIKNLSAKEIRLDRLMSLQLDMDGIGYKIHSFYGAWARERKEQVTLLEHGTFSNGSISGMSSHKISPFFYVEAPKNIGGFIGFNLIYSGNHKEICECSTNDISRFMIGLNDFAGEIVLKPGEHFLTPEAVMTRGNTQNEMSQSFHNFINEHLIPEIGKKERPIVFNAWCVGFDFDGPMLKRFADRCNETGIDLLAVDDGWFNYDNDDHICIKGDWEENVQKTGGLAKLSSYLHDKNMKFGLWFEPEVVNPKSKLFANHPDWLAVNKNREPIMLNNSFLLDLANPKVVDYLFDRIDAVINRTNLDYIKWDFNRRNTEMYSALNGCENNYDLHYYQGLYMLFARLSDKHPDVLFEGCAAGGGRFDLGILYYMPQIWTSDCDEANGRVFIQEATLKGFPCSSISCHVANPMHSSFGRKYRLYDRFAVAAQGTLGYEINFDLLDQKEVDQIKDQIKTIRHYQKTLQFGNYYLLETPEDYHANITVSKDKKQAVARIYQTIFKFNVEPPKFSFAGLDNDATYIVKVYGKDVKFETSGKILNNFGIDLSSLFLRDRTGDYDSTLNTLLVLIDKK